MGTKKTYLLNFVSLCIISKISIPVCRQLQFFLTPVSHLVASQYWCYFHLCHKYHKPQKKMAIQSQNCTSSLSCSGNQIFMLVNNRDVTKDSASIKEHWLFPSCLCCTNINIWHGRSFLIGIKLCWKLFSKGNSQSAHNRRFCLIASISVSGWYFIKLRKGFFPDNYATLTLCSSV